MLHGLGRLYSLVVIESEKLGALDRQYNIFLAARATASIGSSYDDCFRSIGNVTTHDGPVCEGEGHSFSLTTRSSVVVKLTVGRL